MHPPPLHLQQKIKPCFGDNVNLSLMKLGVIYLQKVVKQA
jgi:hypothetical protein